MEFGIASNFSQFSVGMAEWLKICVLENKDDEFLCSKIGESFQGVLVNIEPFLIYTFL